MVYILQTRLWDGSWETVGTDENGDTQTHPDAASATQDLEAHLEAMRDAVTRGDMTDYNPEDWRISRLYRYTSGGDALEVAEGLGWVDDDGPDGDLTEASALDFIAAKGYAIEGLEDIS